MKVSRHGVGQWTHGAAGQAFGLDGFLNPIEKPSGVADVLVRDEIADQHLEKVE